MVNTQIFQKSKNGKTLFDDLQWAISISDIFWWIFWAINVSELRFTHFFFFDFFCCSYLSESLCMFLCSSGNAASSNFWRNESFMLCTKMAAFWKVWLFSKTLVSWGKSLVRLISDSILNMLNLRMRLWAQFSNRQKLLFSLSLEFSFIFNRNFYLIISLPLTHKPTSIF